MLIRDLTVSDMDPIVTLNNLNTPAVNAKSVEQMTVMVKESVCSLGAFDEQSSALLGFMITFLQGASYESMNYAWFTANYTDFAYMDRIVVAPQTRSMGIGAALYHELFFRLAPLGERAPFVGIDVNVRPANEGSIRFHQRLGFVEVAQQDTDSGAKTVSLMVKHLP